MRQKAWIWATALLTVGVGLSADEEAVMESETALTVPTEQISEPLEPVVVEVQTNQEVLATEETAAQEGTSADASSMGKKKETAPAVAATSASQAKKKRTAKSMAPKKDAPTVSAARAVMEEETRLYYEVDE
jgi:hypothetical protein